MSLRDRGRGGGSNANNRHEQARNMKEKLSWSLESLLSMPWGDFVALGIENEAESETERGPNKQLQAAKSRSELTKRHTKSLRLF